MVTDKIYLFLIPQLLLYCAIFLYQCTKQNKACIITCIISFKNATQLIKQNSLNAVWRFTGYLFINWKGWWVVFCIKAREFCKIRCVDVTLNYQFWFVSLLACTDLETDWWRKLFQSYDYWVRPGEEWLSERIYSLTSQIFKTTIGNCGLMFPSYLFLGEIFIIDLSISNPVWLCGFPWGVMTTKSHHDITE